MGGAEAPAAASGKIGSPERARDGGDGGDRRRRAWEDVGDDWHGLRGSSASCSCSSSSAGTARRRRASPGVPEHGTEGQVSAASWVSKAEWLEGEKRQQQHGCTAIVYLGHGGVAEDMSGVHALLARHRG